jgi:type I restriction enzyme M protein
MESMSGSMVNYSIFMANIKKVGKDRRGNFIYKKDEKGKEIVNRDLYKSYSESSILDFLPVVETTGRIVDDELPQAAELFLSRKKMK